MPVIFDPETKKYVQEPVKGRRSVEIIGVDGKDGRDGKDGKDGVDGKDGLNGKDGKDGKNGLNGKDGADGKDGRDGQDGIGIKDIKQPAPSELKIELTNGESKSFTLPSGQSVEMQSTEESVLWRYAGQDEWTKLYDIPKQSFVATGGGGFRFKNVVETLVAGSNVTITPNYTTKKITIEAAAGGGSPGGSSGQVQFNDGGSFGGSSSLTWDGATFSAPRWSSGSTFTDPIIVVPEPTARGLYLDSTSMGGYRIRPAWDGNGYWLFSTDSPNYRTRIANRTELYNSTAAHVPLTIRGAASQSGNLTEWQNSAGTALAFVSAGGTVTTRAASASSYNAFEFRDSANIARAWVDITGQAGTIVISDVYSTRYAGVGTAPSSAAQAQIVTDLATRKALTVKGASAQTAALQEWQNSAGTVLASVSAAGNGAFVNLTSIPQQAGFAANDISLFTTHFRQSPNGIDLRISEPSSSFNGKVFGYSSGRIGYGTGNLSGGLLDAKMEFRGTQLFIDALSAGAVQFTENNSSNNNFLSLYHDSSTADTDRFYIHTAKIANTSFRPHLELGGRTFSLRTGLNGNAPLSNAITFSVSENGAALLQPSTASTVPLSVRGAASHTANLQEWQNSGATAVAGITNNGDLFLNNISGSNTTARLAHTSGNSSVFSGWLNNTTQTIGIGFNVVGQYGGGTTGTNGRNLFVYDYVSGAYRFGIGPAGDFYYGDSNTNFSVRMLPSNASNVPLSVRAAASQTANLQQWQDNAGTVLASITAAGFLNCVGADLGAGVLTDFRADNTTNANTTITIGSADTGRIIETTAATAVSVTLSATATVGTSVTVVQAAAGQCTFASTGSGTVRNRQSQFKTAGQWAIVTMYVRTNAGGSAAEWVLGGDTAA